MKIIIGSDHAGYTLKEHIKTLLKELKYEYIDEGTFSNDSIDYPEYAHSVAQKVNESADNIGFLVCGSGNGVCMTANKYPNIRAALCWNEEITKLARLHNDANVCCLPARFISEQEAEKCVNSFIKTDFEGGRHQRRVLKINM